MFYAASMVVQKKLDLKDSNKQQLVEVASQDGEVIRTFSGSTFKPDTAINGIKHTDLIIIPGIWGDIDAFLAKHQHLIEWLKQQYQQGALIACMSSGTFLLAETGLLDAKSATTYWRMVDQFRARFPKVILQPERKITSADNLFCSGGIGSGIELAIYLIERIWGIDVAQKVAQNFLMDMHREAPAFQLVFDQQKRHEDKLILQAQQWLEANFSADFLLEEVADKIGLGLRSFMRRFKKATGDTPLNYLQRIRVETAKELLEHSAMSVDEISYRVGYEDTSFFCRLFKRNTNSTPSEFRSNRKKPSLPN